MKFKITLLSIVLFLMPVGALAQPKYKQPFNPFYICQASTQWHKYLFYGEIVAIENLSDVNVNSKMVVRKATIRIEKSFKEKLPPEITLYIGINGMNRVYSVGDKYLFQAADGKMNDADEKTSKQKIYFTETVSRPMTDYSAKAVKEVIDEIEAALGDKNVDFVEGAIFEYFSRGREVSLKPEDADRLAIDIRTSEPFEDILVEATGEKDGKIYQSRTDREGRFRIDNIPPGNYKIKLYLPADKEQGELSTYSAGGTLCSRKWYFPVRAKTSD